MPNSKMEVLQQNEIFSGRGGISRSLIEVNPICPGRNKQNKNIQNENFGAKGGHILKSEINAYVKPMFNPKSQDHKIQIEVLKGSKMSKFSDRKSTRLNSSHSSVSRMPSSA